MNSAILVGRVGQDPEIKYFESTVCFTEGDNINQGKST